MRINASTAKSAAVLILSACERTRASLQEICAGQYHPVYAATDLAEAVALLRRYAPPVVICNSTWREFLDVALSGDERTCVIVTDRFADEALWAEVLNLGGFDVLAQPLEPDEVLRSIQAAFRCARAPNYHAHSDCAVAG